MARSDEGDKGNSTRYPFSFLDNRNTIFTFKIDVRSNSENTNMWSSASHGRRRARERRSTRRPERTTKARTRGLFSRLALGIRQFACGTSPPGCASSLSLDTTTGCDASSSILAANLSSARPTIKRCESGIRAINEWWRPSKRTFTSALLSVRIPLFHALFSICKTHFIYE